MQKLILLVGNIGTGKTTWIRNYLKSDYPGPEALVVNMDSISTMLAGKGTYEFDLEKVVLYTELKKKICIEILKAGYSCIVDGTHISRQNRKMYIDIAKDVVSNIDIEVVDFGKGTIESLARRIKENRDVSYKVWNEVHIRFYDAYEQPSYDEGINKIISVFEDKEEKQNEEDTQGKVVDPL